VIRGHAPPTASAPMRALLPLTAAVMLAVGCTSGSSGSAKAAPFDWADQPLTDEPGGRSWAKAGSWYSSTPRKWRAQVGGMLDDAGAEPQGRGRVLITPHAGIKYSGPIAAEAWSRVEVPDLVIILAPDHSRTGPKAAIWDAGPWHLPGHAFAIDHAVVERAKHHMPTLEPSRVAFRDHEAEMNLPFLAMRNPDARLVVMSFHDDDSLVFPGFSRQDVQTLGQGLADLLAELDAQGTESMLVLTTDLVHYQPVETIEKWDPVFMEQASKWDVAGLRETVEGERLSFCGEVPVSIGMTAMALRDTAPMQWTTRGHSGQTGGKGKDTVVGYGGGARWD